MLFAIPVIQNFVSRPTAKLLHNTMKLWHNAVCSYENKTQRIS